MAAGHTKLSMVWWAVDWQLIMGVRITDKHGLSMVHTFLIPTIHMRIHGSRYASICFNYKIHSLLEVDLQCLHMQAPEVRPSTLRSSRLWCPTLASERCTWSATLRMEACQRGSWLGNRGNTRAIRTCGILVVESGVWAWGGRNIFCKGCLRPCQDLGRSSKHSPRPPLLLLALYLECVGPPPRDL